MNLTAFVGKRISLKRDSDRASAGVLIAVTGISVAFVIMLLAISIVSGFKNEIVRKLEAFHPHISVLSPSPDSETDQSAPVELDSYLLESIKQVAPEAEVSLSISQPAVFKTDSAFQGIVLRGISSPSNWDFVASSLVEGNVPDMSDTMTVVISKSTAAALGLDAGEKILTHFFDGNSLRTRNLKITGIFDSHFNDFDATIAFTPLAMLQNVFGLSENEGTSVDLRNMNMEEASAKSQHLYSLLLQNAIGRAENGTDIHPRLLRVENINEQCAMYMNWLNLLDTNVVVILALMAFVSGFTLVSSLFIIILEKVNMIGLFKALGATNAQLRSIFIFMAQRLVVRGLVIGNIIGLGVILVQRHTHWIPLDPDAYYLNFVPMDLSIAAIVALNIGVIAAAALILVIPSCLISSLSPVKSLKYE